MNMFAGYLAWLIPFAKSTKPQTIQADKTQVCSIALKDYAAQVCCSGHVELLKMPGTVCSSAAVASVTDICHMASVTWHLSSLMLAVA